MEIYVFVRFHAQLGKADALQEALREVVSASRKEEGCVNIQAFRSIRDPQIFYVHSRWKDEAAFDIHARLRIPCGSSNERSRCSITRFRHSDVS